LMYEIKVYFKFQDCSENTIIQRLSLGMISKV